MMSEGVTDEAVNGEAMKGEGVTGEGVSCECKVVEGKAWGLIRICMSF